MRNNYLIIMLSLSLSMLSFAEENTPFSFTIETKANTNETVTLTYPNFSESWINALIEDPNEWYADSVSASEGMLEDFGLPGVYKREVKILPSLEGILVLEDHQSQFAGGSSGLLTTHYFNIDLISKKDLKLENIVSKTDMDDFIIIAEQSFRSKNTMSSYEPNDNISFLFPNETFYLPSKFYIGKEGLVFIYETGEISANAVGEIQFTIPYYQLIDINPPKGGTVNAFIKKYIKQK